MTPLSRSGSQARPARTGPKHLAVPHPGDTVDTVRYGNQHSSPEGKQATSSLLWWMFVALLIYLLPFIALTVDEVVLHTNWFSKDLPPWFGDVMRALYPFSVVFAD